MNDTPWARYVRRTSGGAGGSEIEKRTGIRQSNISRWLNDGTTPQPAQAAKFAQAYDGNVLEAFVAAGFLTPEDAGVPPRPDVDFYALVDEDPDLSAQAKVHLKNQYGLLKAASAHTRSAAARELIENDDELDDATKARLLARLSDPRVDVVYSSSATVVERPFPRIEPKRPRYDVQWSDLSDQVRAYIVALADESAQAPQVMEALNERLVHERRVDTSLANEARHVIWHYAGSGKTEALVNAVLEARAHHDFDLRLTDEDRKFLDEIRVGGGSSRGVSDPAGTPSLAIAAYEEEAPIAGEQESPTEP